MRPCHKVIRPYGHDQKEEIQWEESRKPRRSELATRGYLTRWRTDYEALKAERDALASDLAELYPTFEARIADLLPRIAARGCRILMK